MLITITQQDNTIWNTRIQSHSTEERENWPRDFARPSLLLLIRKCTLKQQWYILFCSSVKMLTALLGEVGITVQWRWERRSMLTRWRTPCRFCQRSNTCALLSAVLLLGVCPKEARRGMFVTSLLVPESSWKQLQYPKAINWRSSWPLPQTQSICSNDFRNLGNPEHRTRGNASQLTSWGQHYGHVRP